MAETDFISVFAQLLNDGAVRDAFRANPARFLQELTLRPADRAALLAIDSQKLEAQARVLLRKRFDEISPWLPRTLESLGAASWPRFAEFARERRRAPADGARHEAAAFVLHLSATEGAAVDQGEANRLAFQDSSRRLAIKKIAHRTAARTHRCALQVQFRLGRQCYDWRLFLG